MTLVAFPGVSLNNIDKSPLSGKDLLAGVLDDLEKGDLEDKIFIMAKCSSGYRLFLNESDPTAVLQWIYYIRYVIDEFEEGYIATLP